MYPRLSKSLHLSKVRELCLFSKMMETDIDTSLFSVTEKVFSTGVHTIATKENDPLENYPLDDCPPDY